MKLMDKLDDLRKTGKPRKIEESTTAKNVVKKFSNGFDMFIKVAKKLKTQKNGDKK